MDPYHYYLIIPVLILVVQLVCVILIYIFKHKLSSLFNTNKSTFNIPTRKEVEEQALKSESTRKAQNHSILTQQGDNNEY